MKKTLIISLALMSSLSLSCKQETRAKTPGCSPLLDHTLNNIDGERQNLCQYQGKVILVVNTASQCGNTPQYSGLQTLHEKYSSKGFTVLGFPSNDFGKQEPGSASEIKDFCKKNYQVTFPLFDKSRVKKSRSNAFYSGLISKTGEEPIWNFHKYLIDKSGKQVLSFDSSLKPQSTKLTNQIEDWL